jgi:hypothetical protein
MKEKLLRLLREVLRVILLQRGWRRDADKPATPPPPKERSTDGR